VAGGRFVVPRRSHVLYNPASLRDIEEPGASVEPEVLAANSAAMEARILKYEEQAKKNAKIAAKAAEENKFLRSEVKRTTKECRESTGHSRNLRTALAMSASEIRQHQERAREVADELTEQTERAATARSVVARNVLEAQARSVKHKTDLMQRFRQIAREINLVGAIEVQCNSCQSLALATFVAEQTGIDPEMPREEMERRVQAFMLTDDYRVPHQREFLFVRCSNGCYICVLCAGSMLGRRHVARGHNMVCPCTTCSGTVPSTGLCSLEQMAHNHEERMTLAQHMAYRDGPAAQELPVSNRPDLDRVWSLYQEIDLSLIGSLRCPQCFSSVQLPEFCAHITCTQCKTEFCSWCVQRIRSIDVHDTNRFAMVMQNFMLNTHMIMCQSLLWAMYWTHYDWSTPTSSEWATRSANSGNPWRFLVTSAALLRNYYGAIGTENDMPVAGQVREGHFQPHEHFAQSLPAELRDTFSNSGDWRPRFQSPTYHTNQGFARMWGGGRRAEEDTYANRMFWRRPRHVATQVDTYVNRDGVTVQGEISQVLGYAFEDYRRISSLILHFTVFCQNVEQWLYEQTVLARLQEGLCITPQRLADAFAFALRARHRLEANTPWQVLMAMRAHQLREGPMYGMPALEPDLAYAPFAHVYVREATRIVPVTRYKPYFDPIVRAARGHGPAGLDRQPWEGIPFINPMATSISDIAAAGVVYARVLLEQPEGMTLQTWEFSMTFHRRFVALMNEHMAQHEEGPMPPALQFERKPGM